ncbi:kelch-like protein 10 [Puntigrus tetrazona]|uniref:kelch-like protein 10 n=1 Tax=Puntigrus tetrazona TaxID=1606681 RepID=UPI001C895E1F|nr:kelch-like protein 10 [Puntigrus tetrazona]
MENKISDTAFNVFDEVRLQGEHTDVLIKVQDTHFKVHKIILCGCSPYFRIRLHRTLFSSQWTNKEEQSYNVAGMSSDTMSLIIQYAYARPVLITEESVPELLAAADQFLISGLIDDCCQFLEANLSLENCIGTCMLAECFPTCSAFLQKTRLYILHHFEEVTQVSEEFMELPLGHLTEMIAQDELNVKQEEVVFEAIIRWIGHAPENRRKHIDVLLSKVRMGLMSPDYFMTDVRNNALVLESEACSEIVINAMKVIFDLHMEETASSELANKLTRPRLPYEILLAIGGWSISNPTNEIEAYDAKADCWVSVTPKDELPRAYLGTAVLDGFVYCLGGFDSENYFSSVRKFNPITQTWQEVAPMYERRCYVSVAVLDGLIYAIGGFNGFGRLKTAERYDANANQWTMMASMNERRSDASATALQGKVSSFTHDSPRSTVYKYCRKHVGHCQCVMCVCQVYICGGFTGVECLMSAESFDPQTNQWSLIAPMRSRRSGVGVITYGNLIYAVGGFDGAARLRSAEAYNPLNDTWHDIRSMINSRSNFGIEVVDDQLVVVGGFNGVGTCRDVECYDRKMDEWYEACSMSVSRSAVSCCVISGLPDVTQYVVDRDSLETSDYESDSD